ncbi:tRNA-uridine aminocarboxypropyltransferase [Vibrio hippocampi]|uniref:tRNA-uridine aminocarboxypropyltransferase n=1 Tax=Vibrio hippocampi TaxID=654686 RepID=A0ABN8DI32_9VIBR|nr:tRNA-uridine aminocarboxypropyltransferase [Vibrio hippocampi]CAH0527379.1 hypothetical protein VHP8226_02679 [Vibrio hippocampi]
MIAACKQCGLIHNCYCQAIPKIACDLYITLLTHENELLRATNTGHLAKKVLKHCEVEIWQRKQPIQALASDRIPMLLFPDDDSRAFNDLSVDEIAQAQFIVLDATWQEAKKMLNRTPELKQLPKVMISSNTESSYALRRNQEKGNLCTYEVAAQMVEQLGDASQSDKMMTFFNYYLACFQAERSGHQYKNSTV